MHNQTFLQIKDRFKSNPDKRHQNFEEIFIRRKIDGTSMIMVLNLCEHLPENCMFVTKSLQDCYNAQTRAKKKPKVPPKIRQNAWHPYYSPPKDFEYNDFFKPRVGQVPDGWFYVQLFSAYGLEKENTVEKLCKYEPLYLHDEVLFQLHRDIAGWSGLKALFSSIRTVNVAGSSSAAKRKASKNITKMLVFRCEMALPGMSANAVTTEIINSWSRPYQTKTAESCSNARKNFQIYILNLIFSLNDEFISEMQKGFKKIEPGSLFGNYWQNAPEIAFDSCEVFSRQELGVALWPVNFANMGLGYDKTNNSAMHCSQNAYLVERLIGTFTRDDFEGVVDRGYGHICSQWTPIPLDKSSIIMICSQASKDNVNMIQSMSMSHRAYGKIDSDGYSELHRLAMPVITTPAIILHKVNIKDDKQISEKILQATSDTILMSCQHMNSEGAVVSFKRWVMDAGKYEEGRGGASEVHCKLKDNNVSLHVPFYSCASGSAFDSTQLNTRCDKHGLVRSLFPMYKQAKQSNEDSDDSEIDSDGEVDVMHSSKNQETAWPNCHIYCYGPVRAICRTRIRQIEKTIKKDAKLQALASLAIVSDLGVTHSAQRIIGIPDETWGQSGDYDFETSLMNANMISNMPPCSLSGNWDKGRPTPVILTPIHSAGSWQISRAKEVLREREKYFTQDNVFTTDYCSNVFKKMTDETNDFNTEATLHKYTDLNDILLKSEYCAFVFGNIFSTMFLVLHMRLMLINSVNDEKCAWNFKEIWAHASKVLKQLICTDLRFATNMAKNSSAAYRPATWPCYLMISRELQSCTTLEKIMKKVTDLIADQDFVQQIQHTIRTELQGSCSTEAISKLCTIFTSKLMAYRSFLTHADNNQTEPSNFSSQIYLMFINTKKTTKKQKTELENLYKRCFPKKKKRSEQQVEDEVQTMLAKWIQCDENGMPQIKHDEDGIEWKTYDKEMIVDWLKRRHNFDNSSYEPPYGQCKLFVNRKNMLARFLETDMQVKYGLFATLHGVLSVYTEICVFDAALHYDLNKKKENDAYAKLLLDAIENLDTHTSKKRYALQTYWNAVAKEEHENIHNEMQRFYQARCKRNTPAPSNADQQSKHVCNKLQIQFVCDVFANWHFGDLGDEARVEPKQLK